MMKHFLRPAALFCTVLCCLALAGCSPSAPGAQPGSTAAPATQQSSLTWLPAGIACAVSEAGYYDILISYILILLRFFLDLQGFSGFGVSATTPFLRHFRIEFYVRKPF